MRPLSKAHIYFSKAGILTLLVLIGLLLLLFTGELALSLVQAGYAAPDRTPVSSLSPTAGPSPQSSTTTIGSFILPGYGNASPLQLSDSQYIIYEQSDTEQSDTLYLVSASGNFAQVIPTTGFISSRATPPILMPDGELLYSGDGIWITGVFGGTPRQIATLDAGQVITSMALSADGKMLAWSTEPANGSGQVEIHAGPIGDPSIVLAQSALSCPCFRIFSYLNGTSAHADTTLLLTDDRGSNEAVQYGLWSLDLAQTSPQPQPILVEEPQQGPLIMSPHGNTLLYSTSEGAVPVPSNLTIPGDFISLSYANSLSLGTLNISSLALSPGHVILPEQDNLSNSSQYHWVTTPVFSPDARTLAYVEFSIDEQPPYTRHSALYTVSISASGSHLAVGKPKLLATSSNQLVELGPWLNNHILTIYADGTLYALDIQSGSMAVFAQPNSYAKIVAVVGSA